VRTWRVPIVAILAGVLLGTNACSERSGPTESAEPVSGLPFPASGGSAGRYLVVFGPERVPADFADRVAKLGGDVEASLEPIGVASVTGLTATAATELAAGADIRAVEADPVVTMVEKDTGADDASIEATASDAIAPADAAASPTAAQFYGRQWNLPAVSAPQAWAAGHFGSRDVLVAILDTGIDYLHPDLAGLVDLERSKSFVPEEDALVEARFPGRLPFSDLYWHGTAVGSVVASNAKILAGVTRDVTLIAVKIWNRSFQGPIGRLLAGIVYAADQGADVINVSGGYDRDKSKNPGMVAAFERAANYAFRKGTLLVSASFNDAADLDHNGDLVRFPCQAAHAICASATGPTAGVAIIGPWTDIDARALNAQGSYSGFGRSAIGVAAPGGSGEPGQFRRFWAACPTTWTETTEPLACKFEECRRLDAARRRDCVAQGRGTSFAAPTVAGLAALLVGQLGDGNPALIRARILESADDLGEPGTDPYYGRGRINIARALRLIE
jgi:subtilisin family serine protease